ncbi:hypothetical protein AQJ67_38030 [Streptomyces caeruleatus]|uniref:Uncharacterized protein n=1 Tax=Streptomyces caeruleatus TaxID=661399 RepID=A0A117RJ52_9ACTN|nr:hypothetical protein AQJ67_38030 [Streptomyces caeruleatus]
MGSLDQLGLLLQTALGAVADRLPLGFGIVGVAAHLFAPLGGGVVVVVGNDGNEYSDVLQGPDPAPEGSPLASDGASVRHDDDVERTWILLGIGHELLEVTTF